MAIGTTRPVGAILITLSSLSLTTLAVLIITQQSDSTRLGEDLYEMIANWLLCIGVLPLICLSVRVSRQQVEADLEYGLHQAVTLSSTPQPDKTRAARFRMWRASGYLAVVGWTCAGAATVGIFAGAVHLTGPNLYTYMRVSLALASAGTIVRSSSPVLVGALWETTVLVHKAARLEATEAPEGGGLAQVRDINSGHGHDAGDGRGMG